MRRLIAGMAVLALSGCAMDAVLNDRMHNNFAGVTQEPYPPEMVGLWTGSMGPYLVTYRFAPDGGGEYCYSYATADVVSQVKYSGGVILAQEGDKLTVKEMAAGRLVLHSPHYKSLTYTFHRDEGLQKASKFCRDQLTQR